MSHRISRAEFVFQGMEYCRGVAMVPGDCSAGSASQSLRSVRLVRVNLILFLLCVCSLLFSLL